MGAVTGLGEAPCVGWRIEVDGGSPQANLASLSGGLRQKGPAWWEEPKPRAGPLTGR